MKVIWTRETSTVRDVYEALRTRRPVAYTTVMTMMKILEEKGYLKKSRDERAFVYRPAKPRAQVVGAMVRDFVDRVFDGAAGNRARLLLRTHRTCRRNRAANRASRGNRANSLIIAISLRASRLPRRSIFQAA